MTAWMIDALAAVLGRQEWGRAMLAELAEVPAGRPRRAFAAGCARALVVALPPLALAAGVGGLASVAVVAAALVRYPGLVTGLGTWLAVGFFGCVVVTYVVAGAGLAVRLAGSRLTTPAVATGVGIAASWVTVGFCASAGAPAGVATALLTLGPAVAGSAGWRATHRSGSPRLGVRCVGLASLVAGFTLFLLWGGAAVVFAGRPYDAGLLRDFHTSGAGDLATYAVSDSLGSGMMLLLLVPLVSLASGLAGTAVAARRTRAGAAAA